MKNTKKVLLGGVAALALVGTSVFGTYMYLTSTTNTVTNTFTVGKVAITLDESAIVDGKKDENSPRVFENKYHIYPGQTYDKDPIVHVDEKSEESYIFVKVENGLQNVPTTVTTDGETIKSTLNIESEDADYNNIAAQMATNGWKQLTVDGKDVDNVYYYENGNVKTVSGDSRDRELEVFKQFKISSSLTTDQYASLDLTDNDTRVNALINITAYAVQAKGFDTAAEAWAAANFKK